MNDCPANRLLLLILWCSLVGLGCGGSTTATTSDPTACTAFSNKSNQSNAQLMADWVKAQNDIAKPPGTCLNEIDMAVKGATCEPVINGKAKTTWPCNLTVISVADGGSGQIPCPSGSGFSECLGYSSNNTIWVAASGAGPSAITYEMENVILASLGYNTSNR